MVIREMVKGVKGGEGRSAMGMDRLHGVGLGRVMSGIGMSGVMLRGMNKVMVKTSTTKTG